MSAKNAPGALNPVCWRGGCVLMAGGPGDGRWEGEREVKEHMEMRRREKSLFNNY